MDPVILLVLGIVLLIVIIRIFFGLTKLVLKIGLIIIVALILWRVFFASA